MADLWGKVVAGVGRRLGVCAMPRCACVVSVAVVALVVVVGGVRLRGCVVSVVRVAVLSLIFFSCETYRNQDKWPSPPYVLSLI